MSIVCFALIRFIRRAWPAGFPRSPVRGGGLGVGELVASAAVAVALDEGAGLGQRGTVAEEAGAVQVDVGQVQRHRAPLGDLLRLGQQPAGLLRIGAQRPVVQRGGEQGHGEEVD